MLKAYCNPVKVICQQCGKQVKCPVVVANEMSGLTQGARIMFHLTGRYRDGTLSGPGFGAGHESTGSHLKGGQRQDPVDASGRDPRHFGPPYAALEAAL